MSLRANVRPIVTTVVFTSMLASLAGCGGSPETTEIANTVPPPRIRIVLLSDETRSSETYLTPILTEAAIRRVIGLVATVGGEIALGVIDDRIRPLLRLQIDRPPAEPIKPDLGKLNPFDRYARHRRYENELRQYQAAFARWQRDLDERTSEFVEAVKPLIEEPRDGRVSKVTGALSLGSRFLSEASLDGPERDFAVVVSDCLDSDTRQEPADLFQNAEVVVVTPTGQAGILTRLQPTCVGTVDAALRYVTQRTNSAKGGV